MKERLQKYLARCGAGSRRTCEELILSRRVRVNGLVVTELGCAVEADRDEVTLDNKKCLPESFVYLLLNKPAGYLSTVEDSRQRPKVTDLLKGVKERVYPVGRLDLDAEGLILLTNDGDLAYRLTHPKFEIDKVYRVLVRGVPEKSSLERLRLGIHLEDGPAAPARARVLEQKKDGTSLLEITVHEGRKHEIKRLCEAIGLPVLHLIRLAMGPLRLGNLALGAWRPLTQQEIQLLRELKL